MQRILKKIQHLTNELQIIKEMCEASPHLLVFHVNDMELLEKAIEEYKKIVEDGE